MTIERDFETVRAACRQRDDKWGDYDYPTDAALSRIEAEVERRGEQTGELLGERNALKAVLEEIHQGVHILPCDETVWDYCQCLNTQIEQALAQLEA